MVFNFPGGSSERGRNDREKERGMRSDSLNPETLALLAAQRNPQLACDDPAKAIELARKLLIAADLELAEEEALRAEGESEDKFFPRDD